ncbi:MAG: glutaredoxin, partial [Burkholderiales bacterium PBB5]
MPRPILDESAIHPAVRAQVATHNAAIVAEVQAALAAHPVVVVGMAGTPFVRK